MILHFTLFKHFSSLSLFHGLFTHSIRPSSYSSIANNQISVNIWWQNKTIWPKCEIISNIRSRRNHEWQTRANFMTLFFAHHRPTIRLPPTHYTKAGHLSINYCIRITCWMSVECTEWRQWWRCWLRWRLIMDPTRSLWKIRTTVTKFHERIRVPPSNESVMSAKLF